MRIETAICLYAHPNHHVSHRVRLVMEEKQLDYKLILIESNDDEFYSDLADINPYASTPTLVERDLVLYENRTIINYLEERYKGTRLLPDSPVDKANMLQLAWRLENDWLLKSDRLLTHKDSISSEQQNKDRLALRDSLITMSPLFASKPFFMSDTFGLCDAMLAPVLWRLESMQIELPQHMCKPLINYCERLFEREAFQRSLNNKL